MNAPLLACGPYFDQGGMIASLVIFLLIKPLSYFAFIRAFRYRVSAAIPMRMSQAIKLALLRSVLGVVLIGGGAYILIDSGRTVGFPSIVSWVYLYGARIAAWLWVGWWGASLRGKRLTGWTVGGMVLNIAFDAATVGGLGWGWMVSAGAVAGIATFIYLLEQRGSRLALRLSYSSDPFCTKCEYNLTGNLSGICPECGTPIADVPPATAGG